MQTQTTERFFLVEKQNNLPEKHHLPLTRAMITVKIITTTNRTATIIPIIAPTPRSKPANKTNDFNLKTKQNTHKNVQHRNEITKKKKRKQEGYVLFCFSQSLPCML